MLIAMLGYQRASIPRFRYVSRLFSTFPPRYSRVVLKTKEEGSPRSYDLSKILVEIDNFDLVKQLSFGRSGRGAWWLGNPEKHQQLRMGETG